MTPGKHRIFDLGQRTMKQVAIPWAENVDENHYGVGGS
jgi:hypothetical protein